MLLQAPDFSEFNIKIEEAISRLGGEVFPKLNWSSPKVSSKHVPICSNENSETCMFCLQDAVWVTGSGSLKCKCARDVYLLLKSSSFLAHDLVEP